ncbi:MAG: Origin recognition complex, subunit 1 [Phylliscum demangeonii]|nr:MAG: Origin recognition complex, subunit 1 [Phylliscum demangeonii]
MSSSPLPRTSAPAPAQSRAARARRHLAGVGISREDSDDELGYDDHPWEWIYDDPRIAGNETTTGPARVPLEETADGGNPQMATMAAAVVAAAAATAAATGSLEEDSKPPASTRPRKGARTASPAIIGARMGSFQCRLGDCVLLKAEGRHEAWVGLICEFRDEDEEDGGKQANIMWFSTEKEIKNKQKKRMDFRENELYITPSWDLNPLSSINGKAVVMSPAAFDAQSGGARPGLGAKTAHDRGKVFVCRRGCNTRTATYTQEFVWENVYQGRASDIYRMIERVQRETKATRKRRRDEVARPHVDGEEEDARRATQPLPPPQTPRKRAKYMTAATTPKSQRGGRTPRKPTTPCSSQQRVRIKKPLEFTPLGTRVLSAAQVSGSAYQRARARLHVAAVPTALPCRELEFGTVYGHLEAAIADGAGACIYISGTPGTGKTATVREVVGQLQAAVGADELDDFVFVEINGMKVPDPHQAYALLWEALRGERVSPARALDLLQREFSQPSPRRVPCVVLMDELDQLVTKNQSVMYNFFNWPTLRHSRLIVLAVANTMDLPERTLSNKISSRLGLTRITFPGYTHEQLIQIIQSRLEGISGAMISPDAVQFASRKVAAVSGDARRALDICRRAVEIAEDESRRQDDDDDDDSLPPTPSKSGRNQGPARPGMARSKQTGQVTIATVKQAIQEATSSPLQQHLRSLPLASRVLLAAVLARIRRTGVAESVLGDVLDEARRIAVLADGVDVHRYLLSGTATAGTPAPGRVAPSAGELVAATAPAAVVDVARVLGLGAAATELMEAGVLGLEARKGERTGKLRLNVGEEEIRLALRHDPEVRGLGFGS